ncbi:hypothetical protein SAMN05661080_04609, partial [Modestobacter sp. DSM 44400]|uniref:ArdC family protein n=1 Tax=Modestobacter sp. DSM 44400 TaxID=1550230 RepID=UPI00089CAFF5
MLETAARFPHYSLNNQLLIMAGAAAQGFTATRVAGFTTWKSLGRSVVKRARGLAILAPCTYRTTTPADGGHDTIPANAATRTAAAGGGMEVTGPDAPTGARVLRGFRVAHVFDVTQTEGDPL